MPNKKLTVVLITFIFVLVVGYGAFLLYVSWPVYLGNIDKAGVFGDSFGVITSLFSGLAFVGIILTILLQRDELKLQRKELAFTREELKGQKQQLEAQNTTLKKQNFENTFFQLLRLHNEIANSVEFVKSAYSVKGRKSFFRFYESLATYYRALEKDGLNNMDRINKAYLRFYEEWRNEVSHYFRNLYAIVKFIENSEVEDIELYVNLIRVQLTDNELLLLFYHSLSDIDGQSLISLIEKYALLQSLPKDRLLNRQTHESLYDSKAYATIWSSTPNTSH